MANTRSIMDWQINLRTVSNPRLRRKIFTGREISATPAVSNGAVYSTSWNGSLLNAFNGDLRRKQNLCKVTRLRGTGVTVNVTVSRSTPTVSGNLLIVPIYEPTVVIAVTR